MEYLHAARASSGPRARDEPVNAAPGKAGRAPDVVWRRTGRDAPGRSYSCLRHSQSFLRPPWLQPAAFQRHNLLMYASKVLPEAGNISRTRAPEAHTPAHCYPTRLHIGFQHSSTLFFQHARPPASCHPMRLSPLAGIDWLPRPASDPPSPLTSPLCWPLHFSHQLPRSSALKLAARHEFACRAVFEPS